MNPADTLAGLYEQWRALTGAEEKAIRGEQWDELLRHHEAKAQLQRHIVEHSRLVPAELQEARFRPVLEDLAGGERRNASLLAGQIEARRGLQRELDRTQQRLRQIHRRYVHAPAEHWHSYS